MHGARIVAEHLGRHAVYVTRIDEEDPEIVLGEQQLGRHALRLRRKQILHRLKRRHRKGVSFAAHSRLCLSNNLRHCM